MKTYAPDHYQQFHCIADKCRHSCCIGWDIYIDDDTAEKYRAMESELGDRIRSHLKENEDGICISMSPEGRCPFLNECGLCDIITEKGTGYLSEICTEHPRFYNFFSDHTEVGLGLSCEEAARIILSQKDKTSLIAVFEDDDEEWELSDTEMLLLEKRHSIFNLLQDRDKSLEQRVAEIIGPYGKDNTLSISIHDTREILHNLERLDDSWGLALDDLNRYGSYDPIPDFEIPFEKLILYFIYRHCSKSEKMNDFVAALMFSVFSYNVIKALCNAEIKKNGSCGFEMLCDFARQYSAEIEYSEENTEALIEMFYNA